MKQALKLVTGHSYPPVFEKKLLHFQNANHLAESIYEASEDGAIARNLMNDPLEHIAKGLGWYLYNGELVRRHHQRMFVGTVESMTEDTTRLAQLLQVDLKRWKMGKLRATAHNPNHTISPLGKHNLRRWYNETDYAALRELKRFGLLKHSL